MSNIYLMATDNFIANASLTVVKSWQLGSIGRAFSTVVGGVLAQLGQVVRGRLGRAAAGRGGHVVVVP